MQIFDLPSNKTGSNTNFCKNFLTWCTNLEKKLKKLKNFFLFYLLERRTYTVLSVIFSTVENKRGYLKLWMGCQNREKNVFLCGVIENVMMISRRNNYFSKTACFITYLRLHFRWSSTNRNSVYSNNNTTRTNTDNTTSLCWKKAYTLFEENISKEREVERQNIIKFSGNA